ncbi:NmrA/HSCARG family protein [Acidisoma cladoniae]|jgi:uncharacterized protein YbjT (DUF2867 family)|uniref:NmrA/HSCARG family protein n=1 Tax=Acidisoma cladoniae TaxID=3040935 RepID=UPI00254B2CFC|nr:NmrA/HSCARG family protein [Acidisoma sp. PAMC 29798]
MTDRLLLITGATGNQGGASARALLKEGGWKLRALVRDPASDRAKALAAQGVELAKGDLDDEASISAALQGVYGVHSVQTPMKIGAAGEERQGKLLASAAAKAGVKHFIYSSAGGAERNSGVPHFESKWRVEQHIQALELPATILRPVAFMDNFATFAFRNTMLSMWKTYLRDSETMQLVAVSDIGWFVARAFAEPDRYIGQAIELAGDSATRPQAVRLLKGAGRTPALSFRIPKLLLRRMPDEFTIMMTWMARDGFKADIPAARATHPGMQTFEGWATNGSP